MNEMPLHMLPFLPFLIAGLLVVFTQNTFLRSAILLAAPLIGAYMIWQTRNVVPLQAEILNYNLTPFKTDKLSVLFGYLFCIATVIAVMFSLHIKDKIQNSMGIIYAGSALGAVFAGDLLSLFLFWEIMTVSSVFLVWASNTESAIRSGQRYLIIQIASGLLLLAGALMQLNDTGSLAFTQMGVTSTAGIVILIAFGIKAAFPFMHNWVTDSYPAATPTGAVFLCAFTTKVAVYTLARGYAGTEILIYIGAVMVLFPIFYAVIENDMRRVLSYSMINQIGFMVCGIGIGTELAINGAVGTAFNHVIYKGLLFMSMGAVLHMTGKIKASELGGLYKTMPITTILCIIGAASISAVPLFSGFVSKGMIVTAAIKEDLDIIWLCLLFASAGVFHHAGIKIPYFAFFGHDSGIRAADPPKHMSFAMGIAAAICILIGLQPHLLYNLLPYDVEYVAYDVTHVMTQMQLLFFAGLAFAWLNITKLEPHDMPSTNIDVEWLYRRAMPCTIKGGLSIIIPAYKATTRFILGILDKIVIGNLVRHHGEHGVLSRAWPIGSMVLWVAVLLCLYIVMYHV